MNIQIEPSVLEEHSNNIVAEAGKVLENIGNIKNAVNSIAGWQSETKEQFVTKVNNDVPNMETMAEAAKSYGSVGKSVAARVNDVESKIKGMLG